MDINKDRIIFHESCGLGTNQVSYFCESGRIKRLNRQIPKYDSIKNYLSALFCSVFLPRGYPNSVSKDYLEYQKWDSIQAYASSIANTLATGAVLKGVGVGDKDATLIAATITWVLKDGTGMFGRIIFAWINGSVLDSDCKKWRLFADFINDASIFIDLISPYFHQRYFTFVICVSGLFKSIVGVAGGATRAAITQHQAIDNNMADVSAKDGSQETLVNLGALVSSLIIVPFVAGHDALTWSLFVFLTFLHLYCNYRAVSSVSMNTFNRSRFHILIEHYVDTDGEILSVDSTNLCEPLMFSLFPRSYDCINFGCSAFRVLGDCIDVSSETFTDRKYFIDVERKRSPIVLNKRQIVNVALRSDSDHTDVLRSWFEAEIVNFVLNGKKFSMLGSIPHSDVGEILRMSRCFVDERFCRFMEDLKRHEWTTDFHLLSPDDWRFAVDKKLV